MRFNLPDWRDGAAYPNEDSYPIPADDPGHRSKSWAWQFLRRNGTYQADYQAWQARAARASLRGPTEYGLTFYLPPDMLEPEFIPFSGSLGPSAHTNARGQRGLRLELQDHHVAVLLDTRYPLQAQLEGVREAYAEARRSITSSPPTRKRTGPLVRSLRVLDARTAGASAREVAAKLIKERTYFPSAADKGFDGESAFYKDYQRAEKLAQAGYLSLARS